MNKFRLFLSSSLIAGQILLGKSSASAQVVPEGQCAIIVASRPSLTEAQEWISKNPLIPSKAIIRYRNDQYAVSLGLIYKARWRESVAYYISIGQATADAYCSAIGAEELVWIEDQPSPAPVQPSPPYHAPAKPPVSAYGAQNDQVSTALLLFDGETGDEFAGCLNCNKYDSGSVCNKYGEYGSRYGENSIWNRYGDFGSKYNQNSPWNRYGEGLRIVDGNGNYYGRFSSSTYEKSSLSIVQNIINAYEAMDDLEALRNLYCE